MVDEKIELITENGKTIEVVVVSRSPDAIWVVLGEGLHNVKCKLTPTRNGLAYAGSVMGREVIYQCSVKQVRDDVSREARMMDKFKR